MAKSKNPKPAPTTQTPQAAASSPHEPTAEEPNLPSRPNQQQPDPANNNNNNQPEGTDDFESFYLQQVTAEFADDLDKLRDASDFTDKSMPVLIEALKDTARTYSEEEKEEVMGRGS